MSILRQSTHPEGVAERPEVHSHEWFRPSALSYDCCRICGIVKRADGKNRPCKGPVKITLRDR